MERIARRIKLLLCLVSVAACLGCASTPAQRAGQAVDDATITAKVKAALYDDPTLRTQDISVKTYNGTVQLSGFVDSSDAVKKAGDAANRVAGVSDVKNDLLVK